MPQINWKLRFRNPLFYVQLFITLASFVGVYFNLKPEDITSWAVLGDTIFKIVTNPYVVFNLFVVFLGTTFDFTTHGASDSFQALNYDKPRKDE